MGLRSLVISTGFAICDLYPQFWTRHCFVFKLLVQLSVNAVFLSKNYIYSQSEGRINSHRSGWKAFHLISSCIADTEIKKNTMFGQYIPTNKKGGEDTDIFKKSLLSNSNIIGYQNIVKLLMSWNNIYILQSCNSRGPMLNQSCTSQVAKLEVVSFRFILFRFILSFSFFAKNNGAKVCIPLMKTQQWLALVKDQTSMCNMEQSKRNSSLGAFHTSWKTWVGFLVLPWVGNSTL